MKKVKKRLSRVRSDLPMLSQTKGISVMVGYVLLVSFAIVISALVYKQMKTYVPTEGLECPEGTSVFVKDYFYNCSSGEFNITLKNNGRFAIGGYFIHATNDTDQTVATIDLSKNITGGGYNLNPGVTFNVITTKENVFAPGEESTQDFGLINSYYGNITSIDILPMRWQIEENKKRVASCTEAKISEKIVCS